MRMMIRFSAGICRFLSFVGGAAVVLMMLHVTLDVVLLNLFRISMNSTPEIVARYYMVAVAFLPLGWLTLRNQMISVELLDFVLPKWVRGGAGSAGRADRRGIVRTSDIRDLAEGFARNALWLLCGTGKFPTADLAVAFSCARRFWSCSAGLCADDIGVAVARKSRDAGHR